MKAEYKTSYLLGLDVNLVHITMGEKNFNDSLVSFPPHGKSCIKSVFSHHAISLRKGLQITIKLTCTCVPVRLIVRDWK